MIKPINPPLAWLIKLASSMSASIRWTYPRVATGAVGTCDWPFDAVIQGAYTI